MKRALAWLLCAALLLSGCTAPGEDMPEDGQGESEPAQIANAEFGVGYVSEARMDPLATTNKENLELAGLVYEGLFELDETLAVQPVLCDSFEMSGNTYRFRIKSGVKFSDGSALTAGDVVYSLRRALREGSYYAARLSNISGVRAEGGDVLVTLHRANANLPRLLDIPIVKEASGDAQITLGTGPYCIVYSAENKEYSLAKNVHWRGDAPPFQTIQMIQTGGVDQLIWGFESMSIDLVTLDPTGPNPLQFRGEYESHEVATSVLVYLGFNLRTRAFQNETVRRAVACAIDRKSAVEQDYALMGHAALLPVHPLCAAYAETAAGALAYSMEQAMELMKQAGYRDQDGDGRLDSGGSRSFTILVNNENKSRVALAQRIVQSLGDLGLNVSLREEKWEDYQKALAAGDFDLYLAEVNLRGDFNLDALLRSGGSANYGGYSSGETDAQLDAYHGRELVHSAENTAFYQHFAKTAPIIPILFKKHTAVTHRDFFSALTPTQRNPYYHFSSWKVVER